MKRLLFSISLISLTSPLVLCAPLSARADECPELQLDDRSGTVNVSAYGNDGVDPSTQWSDEPVKISKRAPFSGLDAYARHRMEIKGRGLWANLLGVLGDANARDFSVCGLDTRWQISKKPAPTMLDDASLGTILSDAMPSGQTKATFFDVTAMAPPGPQPDFLYNNLYSPEYGIINAAHILGRGWQAGQRRAPDRWSDVTWALWRAACITNTKPPSGLKWVIQQGVIQGETRDIIDHLYFTTQGPPNDWERIVPIDAQTTFTPQHHAFFALLGSPNLIGTVYMLMQHSRELGRKTIESITLVNAGDSGWHIAIKIVPTTIPRSGAATSSIVVSNEDAWDPQPLEVIEPIETS